MPSGRASATRSTSASGVAASVVEKAGRRLGAAAFPWRRAGRAAARARGPDAAAALYRREAAGGCGRPRRLSDDVRARGGRGRGADRGAAFHRRGCSTRSMARGIGRETLTLHVGAGTFLPVKVDDTAAHQMHAEWGRIDEATADRLNAVAGGGRAADRGRHDQPAPARKRGRRGRHHPAVRGRHGDLHHAGLPLPAVDGLITNFHLPRVDPVHAGQRADGARRHESGLCACDRARATASIPMAMRACCCRIPRSRRSALSRASVAEALPKRLLRR